MQPRVRAVTLHSAALLARFVASLLIYEFGLLDVIKEEDSWGWMGGVVLHGDWVRRDLSIFEVAYECVTRRSFIPSVTTATSTWSGSSSISLTYLHGCPPRW